MNIDDTILDIKIKERLINDFNTHFTKILFVYFCMDSENPLELSNFMLNQWREAVEKEIGTELKDREGGDKIKACIQDNIGDMIGAINKTIKQLNIIKNGNK